MVWSTRIEVRTTGKRALESVTRVVGEALVAGGARQGIVSLSVPHTTCALLVNEDEPGLRQDLLGLAGHLLDRARPEGGFAHDRVDDNAEAHLMAVMLGGALTLPVARGAVALGRWQSIFLVELDGPRTRRLDLVFVGE